MILLLTLRHLNTEWAQFRNSHHTILRRGAALKGRSRTVHFSLGEEQNKIESSEHTKNLKSRLKKTETIVGCNLTVQREKNTDNSSARETSGGRSGIAFAASGAKPK